MIYTIPNNLSFNLINKLSPSKNNMNKRVFNKTKAINSLILIAEKIQNQDGSTDKYSTLKILYFAEVKHLVKYGRFITDDNIATLQHGSTPSNSYDLLKKANGEPSFEILSNKLFKPIAKLDIDELSESEIECLQLSIQENKQLKFPELKIKAHDEAYNMSKREGLMYVPIDYIAKQEKLPHNEIAFIKEHYDFIESIKWLNS